MKKNEQDLVTLIIALTDRANGEQALDDHIGDNPDLKESLAEVRARPSYQEIRSRYEDH
jgi:hypothetical protein